jgi:hypothetical protein
MVEVRAQGRTVTGGWPGTRSEARRLVGQQVALIGTRPSHDALEQLVADAYSSARDTWLAYASTQREPTEPESW